MAQTSSPLASVIIRSFNEGWALRETLPSLQSQHFSDWELIVVDSGSTDGSVDLIRAAHPAHFVQIQPHEYVPGRVMNAAMRLIRSPFGIFLNADATPCGPDWLGPLVRALADPKVAAVFGRQMARADSRAVYAHDYERCFGPVRESAKWDCFFSMASSGIRKDVWARRGFLEYLHCSEDNEYARWCRAQGYQVEYCADSVVTHSHNYTFEQAYRRSYKEGRDLALISPKEARAQAARTIFGVVNDARRDLQFCSQNGCLREWPHAVAVRWHQRRGKAAGIRAGRELAKSLLQ